MESNDCDLNDIICLCITMLIEISEYFRALDTNM